MRAEQRSVLTMCGVLCVMTPGEELMPQWCVDNWDILLKVHVNNMHASNLKIANSFYLPTDAVAFSTAQFGAGADPVYLDNVDCTGSETVLIDCPYSSFISCYASHRGAGVRCQGVYAWSC